MTNRLFGMKEVNRNFDGQSVGGDLSHSGPDYVGEVSCVSAVKVDVGWLRAS